MEINKQIAATLWAYGYQLYEVATGRKWDIKYPRPEGFNVKSKMEEGWWRHSYIAYKEIGTDYKIICRPLSDLTKEIESYYINFGGGVSEEAKENWIKSQLENLMYSAYVSLSVIEYEWMLNHHFNVNLP